MHADDKRGAGNVQR